MSKAIRQTQIKITVHFMWAGILRADSPAPDPAQRVRTVIVFDQMGGKEGVF